LWKKSWAQVVSLHHFLGVSACIETLSGHETTQPIFPLGVENFFAEDRRRQSKFFMQRIFSSDYVIKTYGNMS